MAYVTVTNQSWGSRIMGSIVGVLLGIVLVLAGPCLLFWNEGRAIKAWKSLEEGQKSVVTVPGDHVDAANEGKLVALSGVEAQTKDTVTDHDFGVSAPQVLRLLRKVEMYQWVEHSHSDTHKNVGGSETTVTTYTYTTEWKDELEDSRGFKESGHQNPSKMEWQSGSEDARNVTAGAFHLPESLVDRIDAPQPLTLDASAVNRLPAALKRRVKLADGGFYVGSDPADPEVGDYKIDFTVVPATTVSLVAAQVGSSFEPYKTKVGRDLQFLYVGAKSADEMFAAEKQTAAMITWLVRLGGFLMVSIGLGMIAKPAVVVADVLPFVGSMLGAGVALFSLFVGFGISLVTIAIGWVFYRPLIGIPLLLLAIGSLVAIFMHGHGKKQAAGAMAGGVKPAGA